MLKKAQARLRLAYAGWRNRRRIARLAREVQAHGDTQRGEKPRVVLFNASTRLTGLSLNAAFQLLTGWALRLTGVRVVHFVCQAGLRPCVLGLNREDYHADPPCAACMAQSRRLYAGGEAHGFSFTADAALSAALQGLDVAALSAFEFTPPQAEALAAIPLGRLVLPSVRWTLRRHTLPDDEPTRYLLRQYILSAYNVIREFGALLRRVKPRVAVIFNGAMYPEAAARWIARQLGVRSVAHEVGFQRYSTFFTEGEPTAYPIAIPAEFELSPQQDARLDAYLEQRFQGQFTMAGIRFWPEMRRLDEAFLQKAARFRQVVPVFTNVVYDTSQVHANVVFPHMFAWLDAIAAILRAHPETLFVIRAHPDEFRAGTKKLSNESVHDWVEANGLRALDNVVFIDSQEFISSYELIQRARFVVVYNSSIGLEAALMGAPVLCGGKARYTQLPTVFFPPTQEAFCRAFELFLGEEPIAVPAEFARNARRFLYYQLYRASLPLDEFIEAGPRMGFVQLRDFGWRQLLPANTPALRVLAEGILEGQAFLMPENEG
jgi:hypothetical protein